MLTSADPVLTSAVPSGGDDGEEHGELPVGRGDAPAGPVLHDGRPVLHLVLLLDIHSEKEQVGGSERVVTADSIAMMCDSERTLELLITA